MVNGSHSALAYLGAMAGWRTVDVAIAQPALRRYVDALLRDEVAPTLPALPGLDLDEYRMRLLQRFANPALQHKTAQIAMDGSQKLPQRLLGTVRDRLRAGLPIERLALAVAAWIHYQRGVDETGARYEIQDPLAAELARTDPLTSFTPVFGELGDDERFVCTVARWTTSLRECGVLATLESF